MASFTATVPTATSASRSQEGLEAAKTKNATASDNTRYRQSSDPIATSLPPQFDIITPPVPPKRKAEEAGPTPIKPARRARATDEKEQAAATVLVNPETITETMDMTITDTPEAMGFSKQKQVNDHKAIYERDGTDESKAFLKAGLDELQEEEKE